MEPKTFHLSPFSPSDQPAVRALILSGLAEHWGTLNTTLNPDLDDIAASYRDAVFLVARLDAEIVGCGALVPRDSQTGEIVRISVANIHRRKGLGKAILDALCTAARSQGMRKLVLETTASWTEVLAFYETYGFVYTHFEDDEFGGQAHFAYDL